MILLTVLLGHPRPDPTGRFVDHDVSEAVLPPLAERTGNLFPRSDLGDLEAYDRDSRLDAEEPREPILGLSLDDTWWWHVGTGVVCSLTCVRDGACAGVW